MSAEKLSLSGAIDLIEAQGCNIVCDNTTFGKEVVQLQFLTNSNASPWIATIVDRFIEHYGGNVNITLIAVGFDQLFNDVENQAIGHLSLYDGYLTPPSVTGSVMEYDGWADLTPYIQERSERIQDWSDILLGYRKLIAQFEDRIVMFPLDGDLLHLFYRKDVLDHFGLSVPRTWDEYSAVAKATHGKVFENQTLSGSCVGRVVDCAGPYWANLLIASMTQTLGAWSGHLFDTTDMKPLTGPAMEQALQWMEEQVRYGRPDEFQACVTGSADWMREGTCVLSYNWGEGFKTYLRPPTALAGGKYGIAPTPGSTRVLDRATMKLVDCDEERCKHGTKYDDIGWVNRAPYLAFGGWACAVNNYTSTVKKRLATEFCEFAAGKEASIDAVIPNATALGVSNGQDPFRLSLIDSKALELFVERGYERATTEEYLASIDYGLDQPNVVTDIRFPGASQLYVILDQEFYDHLQVVRQGNVSSVELASRRRETSDRITKQWQQAIAERNAQGTSRSSVLVSYQRLRGVYVPEIDMNQIHGVRWYGYALAALIIFISILFAALTIWFRESQIVRASQPYFLVMLCAGTLVLASAIFPLGIDDSIASVEGCSKACMALPWLIAFGWTIAFSALFAKIWRVNRIFKNAMKFRRIKVSETDVLYPFAILFTLNLIILLVWTLVDPLEWTRVDLNDVDSYGTCAPGQSTVWKTCFALLAVVNFSALVLANWQAYQARHLSTEYGESKYIAIAMASILQVVIVGIPLLFLVNENPPANYFIRSSIIFVVCLSILLLVFVPKIYYFWRTNRTLHRNGAKTTSRTGGLAFSIRQGQDLAMTRDAELAELKRKIALLRDTMERNGIDAATMMNEVGISETALASSMADVALESLATNRHETCEPRSDVEHYSESFVPRSSAEAVSMEESQEDGTCNDQNGNGIHPELAEQSSNR